MNTATSDSISTSADLMLPDQSYISSVPDQSPISSVPDQSHISSVPDQSHISSVPDQSHISSVPGQSHISLETSEVPTLRDDSDPSHELTSLLDTELGKTEDTILDPQPAKPKPLPLRLWAQLRSGYQRRPVLGSRLIYVLVIGFIMMIWGIGVWESALHNVKRLKANSSGDFVEPFSNFTDRVVIYGRLRSYDPVKREIAILFSPQMLDKEGSFVPLPAGHLKIYTSGHAKEPLQNQTNFTSSWRGPGAPERPGEWLTQWQASIDVGETTEDVWGQPDYGYPFDLAFGTYHFSATLDDKHIPVVGVIMVESILNYYVTVTAWSREGCTDQSDLCYLPVSFNIQRPGYVRFAAMVVLVVNWAVTLALCLLTGELVLAKRVHILRETDELAVYFAALFTMPSIRVILPGAPSYGCLFDMFGILPCIVLISCCAFILTFWRISRDKNTTAF